MFSVHIPLLGSLIRRPFYFLRSYLNDSNEAHIVVVAKDSGTPARQTSVAVAVSFGEDSNKYGRRLSGFENIEDDALTLAISLGLVVVVFLIVIVSLIAYICNSKVGKKRYFI